MLVVVNRLFVKKEMREEFEAFIASRMEFLASSSVLEYSLEKPVKSLLGDTDHYLLRSVWRDDNHLQEWMRTPGFREAHIKLRNHQQEFYFQKNELLIYEIMEQGRGTP